MQMTRRDLILGAMGAALLPARAAIAGTTVIGGPAFGSSWRATIGSTVDAETARRRVQDIIAEVDACFSPYRRDSDVSRFNAAQTSRWQPVPAACAKVARAAMTIAEMTDGCFDPTMGPLVAQQGFGPISGRAGSFREIEVGERSLKKASPDITLDFCGIAKGYALDRIEGMLREAGVGNAIIDVGGEIKALGSHPDGRPWAVAIADPTTPGTARQIVALHGLALATSGHATNAVQGRVDASHIIDPHRRGPAAQALRSVSVLDRSAMRADGLATALCAAGPASGPEIARKHDIRAFFILADTEHASGGFETHLLT